MYGNYQDYKYNDVFDLNIDQLEVWRWVLSLPGLSIGEFITSPFRNDTHPRCYVRKYKGILYSSCATFIMISIDLFL